MKRVVISMTALATLVAFGQAASAADLPRRAPQAEYPVKAPMYRAYDWTGFYGGINGGWGWGSSEFNVAGARSNTKPDGGLLGGTIGYNYQWGQTVFGVESDLDWSAVNGSTNNCFAGSGTCETKSNWIGTTRARLGYSADRFMPYLTGGVAYGSVKANVPTTGSDSSTKAGWTVGGGAEYAFTPNWSIKTEYFYVDLGTINCAACSGGLPTNIKFNENIVRSGLNYKF